MKLDVKLNTLAPRQQMKLEKRHPINIQRGLLRSNENVNCARYFPYQTQAGQLSNRHTSVYDLLIFSLYTSDVHSAEIVC